jgi:hypothetical protein
MNVIRVRPDWMDRRRSPSSRKMEMRAWTTPRVVVGSGALVRVV